LGSFGYWRSFINNYAQIVAPMNSLTRKAVPFVWGSEQEFSLKALKEAVSSAPVLKPPDPSQPWVVVTDVSDYGVGASLEQADSSGQRRPVCFFSHSLNAAERRYPVHERELLVL
jgi:hypothetical protein